jgi:hypothetical protein
VRAGWLAIRHTYEGLFCVSDGVLDQTPRTRRPAVYRVAQMGLVFSSFCTTARSTQSNESARPPSGPKGLGVQISALGCFHVEGGKGRIDAPRGLSLARFVFLYMAVLNRGVGCGDGDASRYHL